MQSEHDAYNLEHDIGEVAELKHVRDDTRAILARLESLEKQLSASK